MRRLVAVTAPSPEAFHAFCTQFRAQQPRAAIAPADADIVLTVADADFEVVLFNAAPRCPSATRLEQHTTPLTLFVNECVQKLAV